MYRSSVVCLGLLLLAVSGWASAQSLVTRYVAGEDYRVVDTPATTHDKRPDAPVEVREFFLYTCPHCYHFDPELTDWVADHPNVDFHRVPVLFGPGGKAYARLFYTEEALGVTDRLHEKIFDAIHEQGRPLATRAAQRAFMINHGVDGKAFDTAYDSDAVAQKVADVARQMKEFRVTAVPSMAVGDQYWISGRLAGDNKRMLEVTNYLIQKDAANAS